jgi:hypothetical protein
MTHKADELKASLRRNWATVGCPEALSHTQALEARIEELAEELGHFVDIVDGTEQTGFDPHVEQMLMDAADTARALRAKHSTDAEPFDGEER